MYKKHDEINSIKNMCIIIDGSPVQFYERSIWGNRFSMAIPSHFEEMPPEMAKIKYSEENRPGIIFSDESGMMTVNFSLCEQELKLDETRDATNAIQQEFGEMNPSFKVIACGVAQAEDVPVGWFDFVSPVADDEVYNLIFLFSLAGQLVLGSINCLQEDMNNWQEIFMQMLGSISILAG